MRITVSNAGAGGLMMLSARADSVCSSGALCENDRTRPLNGRVRRNDDACDDVALRELRPLYNANSMASFYMTEEQHKALEALCERLGVERLELFGSATTDAFAYGRSDLDFLVEFISTVDLGPWMATYFDLKDALEKLFGRPVDLVFPSALKNPYFIRSVNETRRTVYERQIAETA